MKSEIGSFCLILQNNLERSEFETKTQLKKYIETLEKENSVLKKKIEDIDNQNRSVISTMEVTILNWLWFGLNH